MVIVRIGSIGMGDLKGTLRLKCWMPSESQEILEPSIWRVDTPLAMTGKDSPFRYFVKSSETIASSDGCVCGFNTPLRVIVLFPGTFLARK